MPDIDILSELKKLSPVSAGDSLTKVNSAERWNAVLNLLTGLAQGSNLRSGANVRKKSGPSWVMLSANEGGASSSAASVTYEGFDAITLGKNTDTNKSIIRVRVGNLNEAEPTPSGNVTESDASWWRFEVDPSSTMYGVLRATMNTDGTVSSGQISMESSPSTTAAGDSGTGNPPTYAYRRLFRVITDGSYVSTILQYTHGAQSANVLVSDWTCTTKTKNVFWLP
jgi:hypothetical protein